MGDILATEFETSIRPETADRWATRRLLESANLTEQSKAILAGELEICVETAFDLYIEARSVGYRPGLRRLDTALGERWHRNSGAYSESSKRVWMRALGNPFFTHIERGDVFDALTEIRNLPKYHGKYPSNGAGIEAAPGEEMSVYDRIRASTFLRFGRTARQVGDLLVELELAVANPFDVCRWSGMEEARLRRQDSPKESEYSLEEVHLYLASPIFNGDIGDVGDPLFWVPLLMRLGGLRVGEVVDLTVEKLRYRRSIPVICLARGTKNAREIPIPKRLQELGLIQLFELRKEQNQLALFPQVQTGRSGNGVTRFRTLFVRYCQTHGIMAARVPADAFRKALLNDLLREGLRDDVLRMAMGHSWRKRPGPSPEDDLLLQLDRALAKAGADLPNIVGPFSGT
ncbi:tyrosine-type recombinase/integrase [Pseudooceanicola sp.]|uniref:tyrosine-type recombinase/integrase n=1 Tax=Pseudooceanicola sp. TaxID=1914328 RepID=UPI0035161840